MRSPRGKHGEFLLCRDFGFHRSVDNSTTLLGYDETSNILSRREVKSEHPCTSATRNRINSEYQINSAKTERHYKFFSNCTILLRFLEKGAEKKNDLIQLTEFILISTTNQFAIESVNRVPSQFRSEQILLEVLAEKIYFSTINERKLF